MDCFWHGTPHETQALNILKCGICPRKEAGRHWFAPVPGRVYLSQDPAYAAIYTIGGDIAAIDELPPKWLEKHGRYGYLFCVDRESITNRDVQPDEDFVGNMLYDLKHHAERTQDFQWLYDLARNNIAPNRLRKAEDGEAIYHASVGKQLLSLMRPWQKQALISAGASVAVKGMVYPSAVWKFDKTLTPRLARDYSNFFELAEQVL